MKLFTSRRAALRSAILACAAALAPTGITAALAAAEDKSTVAYIAPSLDISYWQWVAYGVKTRAAELGMAYVEMTSENAPGTQMNNVRSHARCQRNRHGSRELGKHAARSTLPKTA